LKSTWFDAGSLLETGLRTTSQKIQVFDFIAGPSRGRALRLDHREGRAPA